MKPGETRARLLRVTVTGAGVALTLGALAARALHYSGLALPTAVNDAIGGFLELSVSLILVQLTALLPLSAAATVVVVALWRFWPGAVLKFTESGWQTRLYLHGLIWLQIFLTNFVLDLDPRLALSFGAGVVLHLVLGSPAGKRWSDGRWSAPRLAFLGLALVLAPFQRSWVDSLAVAIWCAAQPWLSAVLARAADWRDRLWPAAVSLMAGQLLAAWMPHFVSDPAPLFLVSIFVALRIVTYRLVSRPRRRLVRISLGAVTLVVALASAWQLAQSFHADDRGAGGIRLGTDLAYNFCESPARGRLAVTVPNLFGPRRPAVHPGKNRRLRSGLARARRLLAAFRRPVYRPHGGDRLPGRAAPRGYVLRLVRRPERPAGGDVSHMVRQGAPAVARPGP